MNERIKQLMIEAGFFPTELTQVGPSVEKFAELIVRECSLVADRTQAEDMGWNIGEIIKEHFGVEP